MRGIYRAEDADDVAADVDGAAQPASTRTHVLAACGRVKGIDHAYTFTRIHAFPTNQPGNPPFQAKDTGNYKTLNDTMESNKSTELSGKW